LVEKKIQDVNRQLLETSYNLNLGQKLKMAPELKIYLWHKMKLDKPHNVAKKIIGKIGPSVVLEVAIIVVAIDNIMVVIHAQIEKNIVKDVLLNGGCSANIITKQLILRLGLPKPKLVPYNLRMAYHTTTKSMGLIHDLKIYVHGIPYITMFIMLQNNVLNISYSILLGSHG